MGIWWIKDLINNYFVSLFSQVPKYSLDHQRNLLAYKLSRDDNVALTKTITDEEVWRAVKHISGFKAPGRDSFKAIFYHTYWSVIDNFVCMLKIVFKLTKSLMLTDLKLL